MKKRELNAVVEELVGFSDGSKIGFSVDDLILQSSQSISTIQSNRNFKIHCWF